MRRSPTHSRERLTLSLASGLSPEMSGGVGLSNSEVWVVPLDEGTKKTVGDLLDHSEAACSVLGSFAYDGDELPSGMETPWGATDEVSTEPSTEDPTSEAN